MASTEIEARGAWEYLHPQIQAVAREVATTDAPGMELAMDSSGGVTIERDGSFAAGAYYYGPQSGWIVIAPDHPTRQCGTLAECVAAIPPA